MVRGPQFEKRWSRTLHCYRIFYVLDSHENKKLAMQNDSFSLSIGRNNAYVCPLPTAQLKTEKFTKFSTPVGITQVNHGVLFVSIFVTFFLIYPLCDLYLYFCLY